MRSRWQLMAATLASSAALLALTVLVWGDWRAFAASPPRVGALVVTAIGTLATLGTDANLSSGKREDVGNRWVLLPAVVGSIAIMLLPPYLERVGIGMIDGDAVRYFGLAFVVVGVVLRVWPIFVLGHRFSGLVAIQEQHNLVTSGPYRYVRHPSYLGMLLFLIGWGFVFRSPSGVILVALGWGILVARMDAEERLLASEFGDSYERYRGRTSRLVPGVY